MKLFAILGALLALAAPAAATTNYQLPIIKVNGQYSQLPPGYGIKLQSTGLVQCIHLDTSGDVVPMGADCATAGSVVDSFDTRIGVVTFESADLDEVCATDGDVLQRSGGVWACAAPPSSGVTSFDTRTGDVTFISSDLDGLCSTDGDVLKRVSGTWTCGSGGGVTSFNSRTGAVTFTNADLTAVLTSADVVAALGYTPVNPSSLGTFAGQNYATPPTIGGTTPGQGDFSGLNDTALTISTSVCTDGSKTLISCGSGPGTGTVTSVGLSLPATLTCTGSPITTSGTFSCSWASEAQNSFFAGPTSGSGIPAFRAFVLGDLPAIADGSILANISGGSAIPAASALSLILDHDLCATNGQVAYRTGGAWGCAAPATPTISNPLFIPNTESIGILTGDVAPTSTALWAGSLGLSIDAADAYVYQGAATPTVVQSAQTSGAAVAGPGSIVVTLGASPTPGNWMIAAVESSSVISANTGWTIFSGPTTCGFAETRFAYRRVTAADTVVQNPFFVGATVYMGAPIITEIAGLPLNWAQVVQSVPAQVCNASATSANITATTGIANSLALAFGGYQVNGSSGVGTQSITGVTGGQISSSTFNIGAGRSFGLIEANALYASPSSSVTATPASTISNNGLTALLLILNPAPADAESWEPLSYLRTIYANAVAKTTRAFSLNFNSNFTVADDGNGNETVGLDLSSPPAIGGTTPAAGAFTTLSATGGLTTNITGGGNQCLSANNSGIVSGTGSACGSGGGGGTGLFNQTISTTPTISSTDLTASSTYTLTNVATGVKLNGSGYAYESTPSAPWSYIVLIANEAFGNAEYQGPLLMAGDGSKYLYLTVQGRAVDGAATAVVQNCLVSAGNCGYASTDYVTINWIPNSFFYWLKVYYDGTNIHFYLSAEGSVWTSIYSGNAYATAWNHIGVSTTLGVVLSWTQGTS